MFTTSGCPFIASSDVDEPSTAVKETFEAPEAPDESLLPHAVANTSIVTAANRPMVATA
jgi:hypothetical protein